jgi:hypothetical protein
MAKRKMIVDDDLLVASREYVNKQMDVIGKFGSRPMVSDERFEQLVYECALPAQTIRDMSKRK